MPSEPKTVEVRRTYLKLSEPGDFRPAGTAGQTARIDRVADCPPSFFRFLYREVGRYYHWTDRLGWADELIEAHLARNSVSLVVMYLGGAPAGYFELEQHQDGSTEIAYFGLLPEFIGRGLGKYLLTEAINQAWSFSPTYVWLHTCSLDDPAALPNYLKRGFQPFKEETYLATIEQGEELHCAPLDQGAIWIR